MAFRSGLILYPLLLLMGLVLVSVGAGSPEGLFAGLVIAALITHVLSTIIVFSSGAMVAPEQGRGSVWGWSLLGCNLPLVAIPVVTSMVGPEIQDQDGGVLLAFVILCAASLLIAFAITLNLGLCESEDCDPR